MAAKARATTNADQQLEYDSQTDVETVVQTYMTGNPDWNESVPAKVSIKYLEFQSQIFVNFCFHVTQCGEAIGH